MPYTTVDGPGVDLPARGPTGDVSAAVQILRDQAVAAAGQAAASAGAVNFGVDPLNKLYLEGDSWTYVDDLTTPNSFRLALQTALDAKYGANVWQAVNRGIGGTTIGPAASGGQPDMVSRIPGDILRYGDARMVQQQGGINDVNLGRTSAQIIQSIKDAKALYDAAGVPFFVCTIGPFKGFSTYNATTRATVDAVNAYIRANFSQVVDLWALLNDPQNDGAMLAAYDFGDHLHPNMAGKTLWAQTLVNTIPLVGFTGRRVVRSAKPAALDQNLRTTDDVSFHGVAVGQNDGVVRPLTIRSPDRLTDLEHIYTAQYNTGGAGWFTHGGDISGDYVLKRFPGGTPVERFRLSGAARSTLYGGLQIAGDAAPLHVTGSTYGGGAGSAFDVQPDGNNGIILNAYAQGGAVFGKLTIDAASYVWQTNGTTMLQAAPGILAPGVDGGTALGSASLRFSQLYATTSTINTSDASQKTAVVEPEQAFFDAILSVSLGHYQWLDAIAEKGDAARLHFGPTAQAVQAALTAHGLDPARFAMFCSDPAMAPVSKTRTVSRQKTADVEVPAIVVTIVDGKAVQTESTRTEQHPVTELLPLVDAEGQPVLWPDPTWMATGDNPAETAPLVPRLHAVPVMEDVTETYQELEPTGAVVCGLRLAQFYAARAEAVRRAFEARLAVLEAKAA